jgi:hypothetical protein
MKRFCVLLFVAVFVFVFSIAQLLSGVANAGEEYIVNVHTDSMIDSLSPNESFEGGNFMYCGGTPVWSWRGMLYYDLSSLPPDIQILSATWHIHAHGYEFGTPHDFALYKITENWIDQDPDTWTWNNYLDSYEGNPQLIHECINDYPDGPSWYQFPFQDLTLLQEWADNPDTNYGFMWKMDDEFTDDVSSQTTLYTVESIYFMSHLSICNYYQDIQPTSLGVIKALFQ